MQSTLKPASAYRLRLPRGNEVEAVVEVSKANAARAKLIGHTLIGGTAHDVFVVGRQRYAQSTHNARRAS